MKVWPGKSYPLGATWTGSGVNFALFSENATKVELCLFDSPDAEKESHRIALPRHTDQVWHGFFPDLLPGQLYGFRVHGAWDPAHGQRFNANKVVLDPYAKFIGRELRWDDALFGYRLGGEEADLTLDDRDSAAYCPLAAVTDTAFTWGDDRAPRTPWHKTLIYECHVKGLTKLHPLVPEALRGTYAGLATEPVIEHLLDLGITAVEIMPVHHFLKDRHLVEKGLTNYWGYNTQGFFAPEPAYSSPHHSLGPVHEFKMMVAGLHAAGIEVILDVVYNHTAEGNHLGPTVSFRGIDNSSYYRLAEDARYYTDFTGCGNTLNMQHPRVLQLIMDSLRYWAIEMHVDGFRFDLASTLARELFEVNRLGAFFDIIHQDPVLSQVKLIAEPWDVGPGGYQVGNFPVGWTEWNGKYRDTVRRFWKGDGGLASEIATRLAGSSDLYQQSGRAPYASVNFITCHDGFTLQDLVSYNDKHNEANLEENRDGANDNNSWNCGVEGPTDDPEILALRARQKRNLMATLFLSQGVPMILAGDELSHTQRGTNNAYCQDNEISWLSWELDDEKKSFLDFVKHLSQIWQEHPVFQRSTFFQGRSIRGSDIKDISWFNPSGQEMSDADWNAGYVKCLGVRLAGDMIGDVSERGEPIVGDTSLLLLNAHHEAISFVLPEAKSEHRWERLIDTSVRADTSTAPVILHGAKPYELNARTVALFVTRHPQETGQSATTRQLETLRRQHRRQPPSGTRNAPGALT